MSAGTGFTAEMLLSAMLEDLCYLDEREDEYHAVRDELNDRYGQRGISGRFKAIFDRDRCQAEVTAVYGEVFSRLGYVKLERTLDSGRWNGMVENLVTLFDDHDMRLSGAEAKLGKPSAIVGDRILCYASSHPTDGWIFVEGHDVATRSYDIEAGRYKTIFDDDPIVRSVRLSAQEFDKGLCLTPYGKMLRWGEAWWIDHPNSEWPAETLAIATQLRESKRRYDA